MKEEFLKYLKDIGITTQTLTNRIEELYNYCSRIVNEDFDDIFIEDIVKKNKERDYIGMILFTKKLFFIINNIFKDEYNALSFYKQNFEVVIIKKLSYDFIEANEDSRLNIEIHYGSRVWDLKATYKNCDYLKNIFDKYFKPILKT